MSTSKKDFNINHITFRPRFWIVFYSIFALNIFFGLVLLSLSLCALFSPGFTVPALLWVLFAIFGFSFLFTSYFCGEILLSVAQLLRYTRNQEIRAKAVIGARNINEYSSNEAERNNALLETVENKYNEMGRVISSQMEIQKRTNDEFIKDVSKKLQNIIEHFDRASDETKRDIAIKIDELKKTSAEMKATAINVENSEESLPEDLAEVKDDTPMSLEEAKDIEEDEQQEEKPGLFDDYIMYFDE